MDRGAKMDRQQLVATLLEQQHCCCFICGQPLDPDLDKIEIDHIIPRAKGGKDDPNNYAATHETCNRQKSDSDLRIARCLARYNAIKDVRAAEGPTRPNLGDFLTAFDGAKFTLRAMRNGNMLTYTMPDTDATHYQTPIFKDKLSGIEYVFLNLPIEYIWHDDRINPRAVGPRIRGLLNEFLSGRPQLHVALAWTQFEDTSMQVHVFDGQHKVVAQMLLGIRMFPLRLFLNPDLNLLLAANTNAGTVLRQVAFDQATQRYLGSQLYWEKIDEYRQVTGRDADDLSFSEKDLVMFFRGEKREVTRYILDDVRTSIIHDPQNELVDYIEFSGRGVDKPLSYGAIEATAYSLFIRKEPLSVPMSFRLEVGENPRQLEKEQIVRLLTHLAKAIYIGKYDFDIGANKIEERLRKGEHIPEAHLRAVRLSREEALFNVLRFVRDLIRRHYLIAGNVIDESELFERKFPEELWSAIERLIRNLIALPVWVNKQISGTVFGVKQDHEYWKMIFETGRDRSGVQVLAEPLNLDTLMK